jgi:iron(II)-dependent oxidoreductase
MGALATAVRTWHDLQSRFAEARFRTDEVFQILRPEAIYERPFPDQPRLIFFRGHVEAFDWNLLGNRAFGLRPSHPAFEKLFASPADAVGGSAAEDQPRDWPQREEVERYSRRVRDELDAAIERALAHPAEGHPQFLFMAEAAIEHRLMLAESLACMVHQLPAEKKVGGPIGAASPLRRGKPRMIEIPAGAATLGMQNRDTEQFGWDNEFAAHAADVREFAIQSGNVTNGNFLLFIESGGYEHRSLWTPEAWEWKEKQGISHPPFWRGEGNLWMYRAMFGEIRLPLDWPVYVSHAEASAYVHWLGRQLPTEAQFHRAAYGTPEGIERSHPWGQEPPGAHHGNFDFHQWDPAPEGSHPDGASAFGVQDLAGNGWEWTRTVFAPFPGFAPSSFYPGYSTSGFDGKHHVLKGASPRTAARLLRRSFRHRAPVHDRNIYASFRCVEE